MRLTHEGEQRRTRRARALSTRAAIGLLAIVALAATACSSASTPSASSGSTTGTAGSAATAACQSAANQAVTAAMVFPTAVSAPALPAGGASKLKGKLLVAIASDLSIPDDVTWTTGVKAAAAAVGARVRILNGMGTPSGITQAISEAASLNPAAVVLWAVTYTEEPTAFKPLQERKIPFSDVTPGWPVSTYSSEVSYSVNFNFPKIGTLLADIALASTKCNLHAAIFNSSVFPSLTAIAVQIKAEVARLCSSCTTSLTNIQATALATAAGPAAVAQVRAHPDTNFLIPTYDAVVDFMVPALKQANIKIGIASMSGTAQNATYVSQGSQTADVEIRPIPEYGWISVDEALRALNGLPSGPWGELEPFVYEAKTATQAQQFLAGTTGGYEAKFEQIWGI